VAEKSPANNADGRPTNLVPYLALDGLAGAVLGVLLVHSASTPQPYRVLHAPASFGIAVALASAASVALRRLAPLPLLLVAVVACTLSYVDGFQRDPYISVGLVMYIVATTKPRYVSIGALITVAAIVVVTFGVAPVAYVIQKPIPNRTEHLISLTQSITPLAVVCAAWALGFAVRRQRAYITAVRAQAQDQVRVQRELAWRAATEERLRIARELHDVVAHGMSVITVQAGVGRHVIDEQPEQARSALAVIESTGRESLREMRRLLGILREEGRDTERVPAPSIADLDELIGRIRQAGTVVDLDIRGRPRALPGVVELSAYRIVQEALTNVVKHARTDRCRISLAYAPETLGIEVTDDGVGAQPATQGQSQGFGHGLIGMRERTVLHGGRFEAGPLPLRGYRVAASLPLEDVGAGA
jgi:signal transduction histidine kinase